MSRPVDPRLLRVAPALRVHLVVATVVAVVSAVALLVQAETIAVGLPRLVQGDTDVVFAMAAGLAVVAVLHGVANMIVEWSATHALIATRTAIRRAVLHHLGDVDRGFDGALDLSPGRLTAVVTAGTDAMEPWIRSYLPALIAAAVIPMAVGVRILTADLTSALILVATIPLIPVFMALIGRATEDRTRRQWAGLARLAHHFHDVLMGMPTLRLFGRGTAQIERVRAVSEEYRRATVATLRVAFLSALALELLATLSVAIVAVSLGARLATGSIGFSAALVVLLLAPECARPLRRVGAAYHAAVNGLDASDDVFRVLAQPTLASGSSPATAVEVGSLCLDSVSVDDRRGLRLAPVDVLAESGTVVAVVGPSGSGKTTLLDVARGVITPTTGTVAMGGVDVSQLQLDARRALVAWIPAHPGALGSTVLESIQLGAARHADLDEISRVVLTELDLSARATTDPSVLSGGERQRVAVARAAVRIRTGAARIVVADEPTAHLDRPRAAAVLTLLQDLAASGAAVLVATHDDAVVAAADHVVALRSGPVARDRADLPGHTEGEPDALPDMALRRPTSIASALPDSLVRVRPPARTASALRWAWVNTRGRRHQLAVGFALGALADFCAIGLIGVASWMIVRASEQPSFEVLAVAAVGVRACGIGKGVFRYAERLVAHDATLHVLAETRACVIGAVAQIAPAGIARSRGEAMAGVVDDVDQLQDMNLRLLGPAVSIAINVAIATVVTLLLAPSAALILIVAGLVVGVAIPIAVAISLSRDAHRLVAARAQVTSVVLDYTEHVREYVAHGGGATVRDAIERVAQRVDRLDRGRGRSFAATESIAAAAPAAVVALTVLVLRPVYAELAGPVIGVLVLWPFAVMELVGTAPALGRVVPSVRAAATRVRALVDAPAPVREPAAPRPVPSGAGLSVTNLAAKWPETGRGVRDATLVVAPGARVVIHGASGSGKSTLAAALVRFIEIESGRAAVGEVSIAAARGDDVRTHVTWAMQEPWIANTSIRENLRLALTAEAFTDDHLLWDVLVAVDLYEFVLGLPDGLDTMVGIDGMTLSSGQRQRLALARTALGGHDIVVLDEPTAHLDELTAERVEHGLAHVFRTRATVVFAHAPESEPQRVVPAATTVVSK